MQAGNNTVEIRGLNADGVQSLPVFATVQGTGDALDGTAFGWTSMQYVALAGVLVILCVIGIARSARIDPPLSIVSSDSNDSIDAVLAADADLASVVDAELVEDEKKYSDTRTWPSRCGLQRGLSPSPSKVKQTTPSHGRLQ